MTSILVLRDPKTNKYYANLEKNPMSNQWSDDLNVAKHFSPFATSTILMTEVANILKEIPYLEIVTMYKN